MRPTFVLVPLTAVLALAGCGGSNGSDTTTNRASTPRKSAAAPTRAEFIAKADAICKRVNADADAANAQLQTILRQGDTPDMYAKAAKLVNDEMPRERAAQAKLAALPVPAGDEQPVASFLKLTDQRVALAELVGQALSDDDPAKVTTLADESNRLRERLNGLAEGYGFQECGRR